MNLIESAMRGFLTPLVVGAIFVLPLFIVGVMIHRQKKVYQETADEPFTQLPLRPPGESLRLKIEELVDTFDTYLYAMGILGVACLVVTLTSPEKTRWTVGLAMLALTLAATLYAGKKLQVYARRLWDYRLGFMGERVVGEELNQLLASGFRVFHDVPFDDYNIDHVLVGPPGVYAVETKTRRKPAEIKGPDRASVIFDGAILQFPRWIDDRSVVQARRNARSLEEWLTKACGERVVANAILTLPGWFVSRRATSDVNVLNPDEIKRSFPNRPRQPLSPEQILRIAHQLTERCRLTKAK